VPELEKLVQLAAVFDVTVGWLINAEEEKVVEKEVVVKSKKTAPRWLCIFLAIALAVSIFIGTRWVLYFQSLVSNLNNYIQTLSYELSAEKANTYQAIQDAIKEYTSSIVNSEYNFVNFDLVNNTVDVNIKLAPKTYKEGMNVLFIIDNDGEKIEAYGTHEDGHSFTVVKNIKITNKIALSAQLIYPDSTELIDLGTRERLYTETFPTYSFAWPLSMSLSRGSLQSVCEVEAYSGITSHEVETRVQSIKCELFEDDKLLCEYTLIDGIPENYIFDYKLTPSENPLDGVFVEKTNGTTYKMYFFERPSGIKPDFDAHTYREVVTVVDGLGRTKVKENYWQGEFDKN